MDEGGNEWERGGPRGGAVLRIAPWERVEEKTLGGSARVGGKRWRKGVK